MKVATQEQTIVTLNRERFLLAKENASLSKFEFSTKVIAYFLFDLELKLSRENPTEGNWKKNSFE